MANTLATTPPPEWVASFCEEYVWFLFDTGRWTVRAGIVLGILLAVSVIVAAFRKPPPGADGVRATVAMPTLDAIKGFLQALTSAPTWLALFGGGILLLWLAGAAMPDICKPAATDRTAPRTERSQQPQGNAQVPAGNQTTNAQGG